MRVDPLRRARACLLLLLAFPLVSAAAAGAEDVETAVLRARVVHVAAWLEATDPPRRYDAARERDRYEALIEPIVSRGSAVVATLRTFEGSPLERRVAALLAARIEQPGSFRAVAPYLAPRRRHPFADVPPQHVSPPRRPTWRFKRLTLELLHPDERAAVRQHPDAYRRLWQLVEETYDRKRGASEKEIAAWRAEYQTRLQALLQELGVDGRHSRELGLAVAAAQPLPGRRRYFLQPRLDPAHLPAWEEALLRPLPWPLRDHLVRIVVAAGSPESTPSLGAALRQALRADAGGGRDVMPDVPAYRLLDALAARPGRATAAEWVRTLRAASADTASRVRCAIGGRLTRGKSWQAVLHTLRADPQGLDLPALDEAQAAWKARFATASSGAAAPPAMARALDSAPHLRANYNHFFGAGPAGVTHPLADLDTLLAPLLADVRERVAVKAALLRDRGEAPTVQRIADGVLLKFPGGRWIRVHVGSAPDRFFLRSPKFNPGDGLRRLRFWELHVGVSVVRRQCSGDAIVPLVDAELDPLRHLAGRVNRARLHASYRHAAEQPKGLTQAVAEAVRTLGVEAHVSALPDLVRWAGGAHPSLRRMAVESLVHYDDVRAVACVRSLDDAAFGHALAAMVAAKRVAAVWIPLLEGRLAATPAPSKERAGALWRALGRAGSKPALARALKRVDAGAPDAVTRLRHYPMPAAAERLVSFLRQHEATEALPRHVADVLASMPDLAVPRLLVLLEKGDRTAFCRAEALLQRIFIDLAPRKRTLLEFEAWRVRLPGATGAGERPACEPTQVGVRDRSRADLWRAWWEGR